MKIILIWEVKSIAKFIKNSGRVFIKYKDIIKYGFLLFYLRELLMSLGSKIRILIWIKLTIIYVSLADDYMVKE